MKRSKNTRIPLCLSLFITLFGCTSETPTTQPLEAVKLVSGDCTSTIELIITYDFTPWMTDEEKDEMREDFRAELGAYFTICDIQLGNRHCENIERWWVNGSEYQSYLDNIGQGAGTGNNNDSGDGDVQEPPANDSSYDHCFTEFPF